MSDLRFSRPVGPVPLATIAARGDAVVPPSVDACRPFHDVAALDRAGPYDVAVFHDDKAIDDLVSTGAGVCFIAACHRDHVPVGTVALVTEDPLRAFRRAAALFHPARGGPLPVFGRAGIDRAAIVHVEAILEADIIVDPGVVIGAGVEIGSGTTIGANSTIGSGVRIGRDCVIDAQVSISNALIGDRVIVHSGVRIGHGGPELDPISGLRTPFVGRVIIQNDVEVGANTAIERGSLEDTVLGEGSSIGTSVVIRSDTTIERLARYGLLPIGGLRIAASENGLDEPPDAFRGR